WRNTNTRSTCLRHSLHLGLSILQSCSSSRCLSSTNSSNSKIKITLSIHILKVSFPQNVRIRTQHLMLYLWIRRMDRYPTSSAHVLRQHHRPPLSFAKLTFPRLL